MKKVIGLLIFGLLLNGCDDGDLTLENIDFENVSTQSCMTNEIIYKLKPEEALLLEMPKIDFVNEPTLKGFPKEINIEIGRASCRERVF